MSTWMTYATYWSATHLQCPVNDNKYLFQWAFYTYICLNWRLGSRGEHYFVRTLVSITAARLPRLTLDGEGPVSSAKSDCKWKAKTGSYKYGELQILFNDERNIKSGKLQRPKLPLYFKKEIVKKKTWGSESKNATDFVRIFANERSILQLFTFLRYFSPSLKDFVCKCLR